MDIHHVLCLDYRQFSQMMRLLKQVFRGLPALLVVADLDLSCLANSAADIWLLLENPGHLAPIEVQHPLPGAVFPSNLPAPVLLWRTNLDQADQWIAGFKAGTLKWLFEDLPSPWRPPEDAWRQIKTAAAGRTVELLLAGRRKASPDKLQALTSIRFEISPDAVETPLFYREVNLPFAEAVKDPSRIRWRFGSLDTLAGPPVVLSNLPVCGNCHSFSADGRFLAMDVDYANSKASYVITRTGREMTLSTSEVISWNDYKKEDGRQTFGLLSQISPDGRYVLSTVKDRSVFVPRPELAFSQLFFPLKGFIAAYDTQEKRFFALPGADDPDYVQSNPTWSPDGQSIIFARNRAAELEKPRDATRVLLTPEECEEFLKRGRQFRFDLYRLPFNGGKGGKPEPVRGASANGRSNYFPKYSPDGRWIVFCQASNYMLLQPDSELYIIPAEGGEARRLACNLGRMNSWHTWSPDGKWLVFSSKAHSDYTQLYLTRMSPRGEATPPVWLDRLVETGRAANIPEFVAISPDAIVKINERFLDDYSYTRAGNEFFRAGAVDSAIEKFRLALALNPNNAMAHQRLGFLLFAVKGQPLEALEHLQAATRLEPANAFAHCDLGMLLVSAGDLTNAIPHLAEAVRLMPNGYDRQYNAIDMHYALGEACYRVENYSSCITALETVLKSAPSHPRANFLMAMAKAHLGEVETTRGYFEAAAKAEPGVVRSPDYHELIARNYAREGQFAKGLQTARKAQQLAVAAGRTDQAARLQKLIEYCTRQK